MRIVAQPEAGVPQRFIIVCPIPVDGRNTWDIDLVPQLLVKNSPRFDVLRLLMIGICIDLQFVKRFNANIDVFGKAMDDSETFRKRSAALELKRQAQLLEPKDGMHDPVVFFHESRIVNLLGVGNGLDKCLKVASLVQEAIRRHVAASPETFSAWS